MILVGYWAEDAAHAPVKALEEAAEADAYATSFREAAEIAVNAARRTKIELVTPLQPDTAPLLVSPAKPAAGAREALKIVSGSTDKSPHRPSKKPQNRTIEE